MSQPNVVFDRLPLSERSYVLSALRNETVGGGLLLGAAVIALVWANSPWREAYTSLTQVVVGPAALHLDLTLATWAADGLLAVFFFVAGLELKHELVVGSLSDRRKAVVPVVAALGGMALPALLFTITVTLMGDSEARVGWGIPMATDIAFALAVLAVLGRNLPGGAAGVPAHPRRRRRPRRDPRHRGLLLARVLAVAPAAVGRRHGAVVPAPAPPGRGVVGLPPDRAGRVGAHARQRDPRDRRRCGARPAHPRP